MSATLPIHAPEEPSRLAAGVLSAGMHLLLLIVLVFGVNWQSHRPEAVSVELWQQLPEVIEAPKPEQTPEPPKPEVKPEPPKPEVRPPAPKPEPAPPRKPDIAVEKEKAAPKVPPKQEKLERLDLSRQLKEQAEQELQAVERERERREALSQFKGAPSAPSSPSRGDAGYADRVIAKIKPLIVLPPGIVGNPEAIFDVEQLPTGEVTVVRLRKSTGNAALDDAVDRAIHKASPLPKPAPPDAPPRTFALRFRPLEK